jgi:hypothetical protein
MAKLGSSETTTAAYIFTAKLNCSVPLILTNIICSPLPPLFARRSWRRYQRCKVRFGAFSTNFHALLALCIRSDF